MEKVKFIIDSSRDVFDGEALLRRLLNDRHIAQKVVDAFLKMMPGKMAELHAQLTAGNIKNVEITAHTIKGAAANVSGKLMMELAFEMEKSAKAEDLDSVSARTNDLKNAFENLKVLLCEWGHNNEKHS